jgi:periplasmic divalent cation tolerance protein
VAIGRPVIPATVLSVTTTVATAEEAARLAQALVDQRLAACVQVEPGFRSFYRWDGRLCDEAEVRLVIKTLPAIREALLAFFSAHHPYAVPQFLAATLEASDDYARWVSEQVADV